MRATADLHRHECHAWKLTAALPQMRARPLVLPFSTRAVAEHVRVDKAGFIAKVVRTHFERPAATLPSILDRLENGDVELEYQAPSTPRLESVSSVGRLPTLLLVSTGPGELMQVSPPLHRELLVLFLQADYPLRTSD